MRTSTLTVALVSALLVAGAGTTGALAAIGPSQPQQSPTGTTTPMPPTADAPGVVFNDQNSTGETVFIQSATLPKDGFVVIYDSTRPGNTTDKIIGVSYLLNAGTSNNIRIQLDQPLNETTSLTAVIHIDTNNNGNFDFISSNGEQDPPLRVNGDRILDIATVTVQSADTGGASQTTAGGTTTASDSGTTGGDAETQTATDAGDGGTAAGGANESGNGGNGGGGGSGVFGPGFGLVIAVVALLAVALLAVRRN